MPPEEDQATGVSNMPKKIGEDLTCSSGNMLADTRADKQTDVIITILHLHTWNAVRIDPFVL